MQIVLRAKKWVHAQSRWIDVEESKRPQTFQAVGRELLGLNGEKVIIVFVAMMQLGICMVFFNFAATNLIAVEEYFDTGDNRTKEEILENPFNGTHAPTLGKPEIIFIASPLALALTLGRYYIT